jgi:ribosomal 30S subunit maturation factor RimM
MTTKMNPGDKPENTPEQQDAEQFIKEMMEQRKLQQEALGKIMSFIDTTESRITPVESKAEEKKILKRIFRKRK